MAMHIGRVPDAEESRPTILPPAACRLPPAASPRYRNIRMAH